MKRSILAVALIAVVLAAGAAFAHGGMWNRGFGGRGCPGGGSVPYMGQGGPERMHGPFGDKDYPRDNEYGRCGFSSNRGRRSGKDSIPKEISDKMTEMQKLNLDMRREMLEEKPDVDLLRELHDKMQKIRNDMAGWHFEQYLNSLNKPETSKE